jgi:hypothetical protein
MRSSDDRVTKRAHDPRWGPTLFAMWGKKIAIAAAAVALAGCTTPSQNAATTVTETSTLQPVITNTVTVTYTPPPPPGPKTTIDSDGTYVVGVDIVPGTYRSAGGSSCYWARLNSLNTNDIIDNNGSAGPQAVEISATDKAFQTEHCPSWHKAD